MPKYSGNKKIAILHDYLYTAGGTEKVLEALLEIFPDSDLYTSFILDSFKMEEVNKRKSMNKLHPSYLNILPKFKFLISIYRKLSFFAFRNFDLSNYDIIIINTSGGPGTWLKKSKKNPKQKIIAYYHKIPSFEFLGISNDLKERSPELIERAVKNGEVILGESRYKFPFIDRYFKKNNKKYFDQIDILIANSIHYSKNFRILYGKSPRIIYPPIDENKYMNINKNLNLQTSSNYYVFLGRLEKYKGIEFIIDACIRMNKNLKVIGTGSLMGKLPVHPLIEYLGYVSEDKKYQMLSNAKALINGSREDFGIIYLDALCSAVPIIAFSEGGVLEIATEGENAILFKSQDAKSLMEALERFERSKLIVTKADQLAIIRKFGKERFQNEILDVVNNL